MVFIELDKCTKCFNDLQNKLLSVFPLLAKHILVIICVFYTETTRTNYYSP